MKTITKIAALLMAVLMIAALAACGETKAPSIVGKWSYNLDLQKMMESTMASSGASSLSDDQQKLMEKYASAFAGCEMLMYLEFTEDGKYIASIDKDSATAAFNKAKEALKTIIPSLYAQMMGMTEEEFEKYLEQQGMSKDQMIESALSSMNVEEMANQENKGAYRLEGDKLYLDSDKSEDETDAEAESATEAEAHYLTISLTADELSITDISGTDDSEGSALLKKELLPMVFKRVA